MLISLKYGGFFRAVALAAVALCLGGCGYKNFPVPPESAVPKAIEDLRYQKKDDAVELSWSYPVETINGHDILQIPVFEVFRAEIALDEYCPDCPIPFGKPIEVSGGEPLKKGQRQVKKYSSGLLRLGYKYFFKVQSRTNWWAASADSNIISFVWHKAAAASQNVMARAEVAAITLNWVPVQGLSDGTSFDGEIVYQLQRRVGSSGAFVSLGEPQKQNSFVDRDVVPDVTYEYRVQSLLQIGQEMIPGKISPVVSVVGRDSTPPEMPTSVRAVAISGGAKIFWVAAKDDDLAGYRVYRRSRDEALRQIGVVKAPYTIFEDRTAVEDTAYWYVVSSYDTAEPANESEKSQEAFLRP